MMHFATRAQFLIDAGYYVAPANCYTLLHKGIDPRRTPYTARFSRVRISPLRQSASRPSVCWPPR